MNALYRLRALIIAAILVPVFANVEKEIFLGPSPSSLEHDAALRNAFERLPRITPEHYKLETTWKTSFERMGEEHWVVLDDLTEGQRYETRICWPATQPTDFWLRVYTPAEIVADKELMNSVYGYARNITQIAPAGSPRNEVTATPSRLYFRALAKAAYFAHDATRMENPEPVDVDIILDPFLLNVFPKSLTWTAGYIVLVAIFAWYFSAWVYELLSSFARRTSDSESVTDKIKKTE